MTARKFIQRCLTIDSNSRMTAHQALTHPWITGEEAVASGQQADLLPTVKKNFNARRTLHAAIDTIRAINQLRAGGAAAMGQGMQDVATSAMDASAAGAEKMEGVIQQNMPAKESVQAGVGQLQHMDPRGNGFGQTDEQIQMQEQRIRDTSNNLLQGKVGATGKA